MCTESLKKCSNICALRQYITRIKSWVYDVTQDYVSATFLYFAPATVAMYCNQSVCLSACLPYLKSHTPNLNIFFYMLSVAVARSFSGVNAICYVFPVLWMTSCIHIMERIGQNQRRRMFRQFRQVLAPGAKSAISDCILLLLLEKIAYTSKYICISAYLYRIQIYV